MFLRLRMVEMETQRVKQWNGQYPNYLIHLGGSPASSTTGIILPPLPSVEGLKTPTGTDKR